MKPFLPFVAAVAGLVFLAACGDDSRPAGTAGSDSTVTGGPCMDNSDCDYRLCQSTPEADFPGGACTISCGDSGQCAAGSWCAELEDSGWVCLVACSSDADCREQWSCQQVVEAGTNGAGTKMMCLGSAPAS